MFLAIINDTYTEVKEELSSQKNELQITDILKQVKTRFIGEFSERYAHTLIRCCPQSYLKTITKLKLKKEKISDVQKVLRSGSGDIEFKDFRQTLKE